ncbi:putative PurR-regulated permease PerM [Planomicrobium stackebrandtii]|uniref:PurR-regulated permease PerM n=1 Tax=Planomicrobium stackebrandtii TaxID=253160 RepID=A0ABU0GVX6_9BACL|nr:AI-2E family transporter [Planomicrobium stackebrandtii]MDQ0429521.1 putative PurR-regulated permease PerM [Planomicrobium stackebrandtii]
MEQDKNKNALSHAASWFVKWVLNNKAVSVLVIILLILLNLLLLPKVSYVFQPFFAFFDVMGLPLIMAGVLYYLLNPLIDWMETKNIKRIGGISIVFVVIIGLLAWGIATLIPIIREQTLGLLENWQDYLASFISQIDSFFQSNILSQLQTQLTGNGDSLSTSITEQADDVVGTTVTGIGSVFGILTTTVLAVITTPFILFYLLKDGHHLPYHIMKLVPSKMREHTYVLLREMNLQISQYIRGQLIVAFFVGLMFWIGLSVVGLEYALTLGILAGALNLIPFLGTFIALLPIVIIALVVHSPIMLVKVLIVFFIEQTLEGRVIQPLVLGSNLSIHPVTIIAVLLTAGNLFGIPGVILGIPAYAVSKVILSHLFNWYQTYTGLYDDEYNPAPKPLISEKKRKKQLSLKKKLR